MIGITTNSSFLSAVQLRLPAYWTPSGASRHLPQRGRLWHVPLSEGDVGAAASCCWIASFLWSSASYRSLIAPHPATDKASKAIAIV